MHVILATVGTDGDIFPHIGLGATLLARGHRVTVAAPETYRERTESLGMEFCSIVTVEEVQRMLSNPDLWHPFKSGIAMSRWGGPMIRRQYDQLMQLVVPSETVLVANPGLLAARLVQETCRVPMASLVLQPGIIPSSTSPPEMPGGVTIPRWFPQPLRRLYWLAIDGAGYMLVAPSLNRARRELKLPPVRRFFRWWFSDQRVIGLFPDWYAAQQPDWPPQMQLAGFGRFDGTRMELSDEIRQFCVEGTPPIAFTLGTGMMHANDFFRAAVQCCESLGARGLLLTKFADVVPSELPPTVRHCTFAPFRKLLPLCGAVVHHGGIGTTSAALEAACPQLVLPLAWDQPDNGARVERLGAGLSLGPRRRSVKYLSKALGRLLSAEFRDRRSQIAERANETDGLQVAAQCVEELWSTAGKEALG